MTLIVMAAGIGSRFDGLKQMQPITLDGRVLLDFSIYDAIKAGFSKIVFVIRKEIYGDFKKTVGDRIKKLVEVEYVFQDTSELPQNRIKPFGTGHAIYCCKDVVKEPFVTINADDYYGKNAFIALKKHLETAKSSEYAMLAYTLKKTLSKNGSVSRGVCLAKDGYLQAVEEIKRINPDGSYEELGKFKLLPDDTLISMNLWGFTPDIFERLEVIYKRFLETKNLEKDEMDLSSAISEMLNEGKVSVKVFKTEDTWYGMTYRADLEEIRMSLEDYIKNGLYEGV